jgi:hypothetical protein
MTEAPDLNRLYLQAVLSWLDIRLEQEVRCWQAAGKDPADRFRGLYISDADALSLVSRETPTLPEDELNALNQAAQIAAERIAALETQAAEQNYPLRLGLLAETFSLSQFEWWAFVVCLAPALELRYERLYAYLQDDVTRAYPGVDLLLSLLAPADRLARLDYRHYFHPLASLRRFRLILPVPESAQKPENALRQAFQPARGLVDWLLGHYTPHTALGDWADLYLPPEEQDEREEAFAIFQRPGFPAPRLLATVKPILSFAGADPLQHLIAARQIAASLERPLLSVRLSGDSLETALEKLASAVRDARLLGALLYLQDADVFLNPEGTLLPACFECLQLLDDFCIFSSRVAPRLASDMPGSDYPLMVIPFEPLSAAERVSLWQGALEDAPHESITEADLRALCSQFSLSSGQILAAASTAMSRALQYGRSLQPEDLFYAARFHSGHHLGELAHKIEPRYTWDDLVLPETQMEMLREMVNMVQARTLVLDEWGLGRKLTAGQGVSALFSGPPGTGKTLAAQIMANQLGIDLYRIDLSTIISKYIGETEKNLERVFNEASHSNAILFFDEADTIFGKRSEVKDAHDRYANIEVGYLLQRMESYSGVSILATNLRANLDEAFTRRLQFIINFPFPDEEYRLKIWQVLLPPDMPRAETLDLKLMADRFKLAGGSIRNIIVSAAFLAASNGGKVEMRHLMHGARRELQKMGKLLNERDFVV